MSLLDESNHISGVVRTSPEEIVHREFNYICSNSTVWELNYLCYKGVVDRLSRAGFLPVSMMGKIKHIPQLVEALVERWRPETNTFHFPCGEMTITLEDLQFITGLPIDGNAVTAFDIQPNTLDIARRLLPTIENLEINESDGNTIGLKWLRESMIDYLPENPTEDQLDRYTRGFILLIIGGILMPTSKTDRVHAMYLQLIEDFDVAGTYSWGSATLAYLYRCLYRASRRNALSMEGCTPLLYGWFWIRFPTLAPYYPKPLQPIDAFPMFRRFGRGNLKHYTYKKELLWLRAEVEKRSKREVQWRPYEPLEKEVCEMIHEGFKERALQMGKARVPLIHFNIVEFQYPDRVMRQFGLRQILPPEDPDTETVNELRKFSLRGQFHLHFNLIHKKWIKMWNARDQYVINGDNIHDSIHYRCSIEYSKWFETAGLPYFWTEKNYPPVYVDLDSRGARASPQLKELRKRIKVENNWRTIPFDDYEDSDNEVDSLRTETSTAVGSSSQDPQTLQGSSTHDDIQTNTTPNPAMNDSVYRPMNDSRLLEEFDIEMARRHSNESGKSIRSDNMDCGKNWFTNGSNPSPRSPFPPMEEVYHPIVHSPVVTFSMATEERRRTSQGHEDHGNIGGIDQEFDPFE